MQADPWMGMLSDFGRPDHYNALDELRRDSDPVMLGQIERKRDLFLPLSLL